MNQLIEYMKIHLISLKQDLEAAQNHEPLGEDEYDPSDDYFYGAIETVEHLLSVAEGMIKS
jgi:hypothetical protein